MPLFKMDATYAAVPQMLTMAGFFTTPQNNSTANLQVIPGDLTVQAPGAVGLAVASRVMPRGLRVVIFQSPNSAQPIPATNTSVLPAGVGTTTNAGEYVIDCGGFPAEIVSATANLVGQSRGSTQNFQADVSGIDQANRLVFIQVYAQTNGVISAASSNTLIAFQVIFKDTLGI